MSSRKDDVTPPPRRVTQELFPFAGPAASAGPDDDAAPGSTAPAVPAADGSNGDAVPPSEHHLSVPRDNGPLSRLIDSNFLVFASYTICHRAIPTVEDGLKPVQRRILHALSEKDDGRFVKVANIVGHTMQYHPHGDASIGDALVNLTNKRYLIEGQGNFGNIHTGDAAAAPRYIECRLTDLARNEVFNKKTTTYIPSYDGRNQEPVLLPTKLPLLLMLGAEGIAVGLSTRVLPHNFIELLEAQIAIIQKKPFKVLPDFQTGGLLDVSEYDDGVGRVKVRARIKPKGATSVLITELPFGQTTESLLSSIEDAIRRKKVPVKAIHDYTAGHVEIELVLAPGTSADKAIKALYAFTACESPITSNIVVIENNRPCERKVSEILQANTHQLLTQLDRELQLRRGELLDAFHEKTLVQIFVEERIYKRIEECTDYEAIQKAILAGFEPFKNRLRREITLDDVEMLLGVRIRRISLFDIQKNRKDIEAILEELAQVEKDLASLKPYAVRYLKRLIKQYAEQYPRVTEIATFGAIEMRSLTASELTVRYDREGGYLGHALKVGDELFKCSSLDKLLLLWPDGKYRVVPVPDKCFVDKNLLLAAIYDRDKLYTLVYTDASYGFTYLKRFTFGGAIMNRDYSCLPEEGEVKLIADGTPESIYVKYKPAKGQRIHQQVFRPEDVLVKSVKSRAAPHRRGQAALVGRLGTHRKRAHGLACRA
jgi:topoisomerase-4 subunit A